MKKTLLTLAAVVISLGAGTANAGTTVGQWTAGAGGLWTNTDGERGVDDGASFYLSAGYAMSEKWDFGLSFFAGNHDVAGAPGERTIRGYLVDFNRVFSRDARMSPFLLLGAGIVDQYRPGLSSADKEVVTKVGGGAVAELLEFGSGNKLQVKVEVAARTSIGRNITDITGGLGLQVAFGVGGN
jgi:hypothetical protein